MCDDRLQLNVLNSSVLKLLGGLAQPHRKVMICVSTYFKTFLYYKFFYYFSWFCFPFL